MKTNFMKWLLCGSLLLAGYGGIQAQGAHVYVNVRPVAPVVVRPAQPSHDHVWVDDEWVGEGGHYRVVAGHWERPPHPGMRWHRGHWVHEHRGDYWIAGGWR